MVLNHSTQGEGLNYASDLTDQTAPAFQIEEVAYSSLTFNTQKPKKSTSAPPAATETVYMEVQKK